MASPSAKALSRASGYNLPHIDRNDYVGESSFIPPRFLFFFFIFDKSCGVIIYLKDESRRFIYIVEFKFILI